MSTLHPAFTSRLLFLLTCTILCMLLCPPSAAAQCRLDQIEVVRMKLSQPKTVWNEEGVRKEYSSCYVVKLKGQFPAYSGSEMDLFVGDYRVREYGSSLEVLYFKVYSPAVFENMNGKPLYYRWHSTRKESFRQQFRLAERFSPQAMEEIEARDLGKFLSR